MRGFHQCACDGIGQSDRLETEIRELETSLGECLTSDEIEDFIKDLECLIWAY